MANNLKDRASMFYSICEMGKEDETMKYKRNPIQLE